VSKLPVTWPPLSGDVHQHWPGKRWWQKPGPWCRTKHTLRAVIRTQPYELLLSVALALFGLRAIFSPTAATPASISAQPDGITILYCALSVVAGVVTLVGLLAGTGRGESSAACSVRLEERKWAPGVEQAGLWFSAAAWLSYLVGVVSTITTARSTLLALALIALAGANLARARAIRHRQVERLEAIRALRTMEGP